MESSCTVPGQLFILAHKLHQENKITSPEKGVLKDLIIDDNEELFQAYEQYLKEGTELTLSSDLIQMLRLQNNNRKRRRSSVEIRIPKRNIQKMGHLPGRI